MKERFNSRTGMMLAMLGMAVGTGNIWRFPRIAAKNGGGEFLVAWFFFLLVWSIPIIMLEFGMGRKTRSGPIKSFMQLMGLGTAALALPGCAPSAGRKPNIVFILADDLGYGELGSYGQEKIRTPNIDKLAAEGMKFTSHYSGSPVCAPSRCTLLTGKHTGHAYIRDNDEMSDRGDIWHDPDLEGQRPLLPDTFTLGSMLQSEDFAVYLS